MPNNVAVIQPMTADALVTERVKQLVAYVDSAGATQYRAYRYLRQEHDATLMPYIVYQSISSVALNVLDGYTCHNRVRMQIDVYDSKYLSCVELAHQVKKSFAGDNAVEIIGTSDSFDNDSKVYRVSIDVFIWE